MNTSVPFHDLVEYVDALPVDDQELLFELIQKRRIEKRRLETAQNAANILEAVRTGTAKRGSVANLLDNELEDILLVVRSTEPARHGWEDQFRLLAQGDEPSLDTTTALLTTWDEWEWES
ncbi:MAG: hypothetical protein RBJ76_12285 [Stenomitos frigidus ULC029]